MTLFIFENEFVICELDDSLPVLKHRWKRQAPGEEFRKNLIEIQRHYLKLKARTKILLGWRILNC